MHSMHEQRHIAKSMCHITQALLTLSCLSPRHRGYKALGASARPGRTCLPLDSNRSRCDNKRRKNKK